MTCIWIILLHTIIVSCRKIMTTKETHQIVTQPLTPETVQEIPSNSQETAIPEHQQEPRESKITMEVVDMRIELIQHRKHERTMGRTLRWPIHSNTPRITF